MYIWIWRSWIHVLNLIFSRLIKRRFGLILFKTLVLYSFICLDLFLFNETYSLLPYGPTFWCYFSHFVFYFLSCNWSMISSFYYLWIRLHVITTFKHAKFILYPIRYFLFLLGIYTCDRLVFLAFPRILCNLILGLILK